MKKKVLVPKTKGNRNPSKILKTAKKKIIHGRQTGTGTWEKAASMRRDGLVNEFVQRKKTSIVVDSRIGERSKLAEEDKVVRRVAREKTKHYKKRVNFNLADDYDPEEGLTHKGQGIQNVERYDDPRDQSGSEDELLDEAFVGDTHFGGFLKHKRKEPLEDGSAEKSRSEIIEELILSNKAKKLEKAKHGDEYLSKVGSLNTLFKEENVMSLVQTVRTKKEELKNFQLHSQTNSSVEDALPTLVNSHDRAFGELVREMKFEPKPARVEPAEHFEESAVATGRESEMELLSTSLINIPAQIPETYEKYEEFLKQNDPYDHKKFVRVNTALINLHVESHRGHLNKLCDYLLKLNVETDTLADPIIDRKCFTESILDIFHRIAEVSPDRVWLAEALISKINEAHEVMDADESRDFTDSDMTLIFLSIRLFSNIKLHRKVHATTLSFLGNVVSTFNLKTGNDAYRLLMLCHLAYLALRENKRYMPEALVCLHSVLAWIHDSKVHDSDESSLLNENNAPCSTTQLIVPTLSLTKQFVALYSHYPAATQIFKPIRNILNQLKEKEDFSVEMPINHKNKFKSVLDGVIVSIDSITVQLTIPRTKLALPKPLRLYEPLFEEHFTGKKRVGSREKQDRDRLRHKIRQEHKGAIRELKKDSACLARVQQRESAQLDATRKRKVNLIMGSLSNEGSFKKVRRGK